jgi:threonine/homoserine/homoserine lactone efflux protein
VVGPAIGEILPLAIGVAISPVPIIAIVLMLGTPRARSNGLAFALGWIVGLTIVGGVLLALAADNSQEDDGGPETWVSVVKLALGVLLLLFAARTWRTRPRVGQEAPMPKWMQAIDTFTTGRSLGFGALLSGVNPKNLALTIAAATTIAATGISGGEAAGALAVFIFVGSISILAPVAIYFALGARATVILEDLKTWMAAHNAAIMAVLLLVLGVKIIGDAIGGLSS